MNPDQPPVETSSCLPRQTVEGWIELLACEVDNLENLRANCERLNAELNGGGLKNQDTVIAELDQILKLGLEVRTRRQEMTTQLRGEIGEPVNLTRLIQRVQPEYQTQLRKLRESLFDKLTAIQTISFSNQVVMNYTMNFYHRLLSAIAGESPDGRDGSRDGKSHTLGTGQLITKHC